MATSKTKAMSNEEWLGKTGGSLTFVNSGGDNSVAWVYDNDPSLANLNSKGQTYAQGTIEVGDQGKHYAIYDGAQNYRGYVTGDGHVYGSDMDSTDITNTALGQSALNAIRNSGRSDYTLDGTYTQANYNADVEANREARKQEYEAAQKQKWAEWKAEQASDPWAAALAAAKAEAKRAYETALAGYSTAKENIGIDYYEQRRQAQAKSDLERANTNEVLNANGLNTGAVGQGALAQSNVLQGDLNALGVAEAKALNDIDAQIAQLRADYAGAIAEAAAQNEAAKATALYQQYVAEQEAAAAEQQAILEAQSAAASDARSLAQKQVDAMIKAGLTPSDSLISASGYDANYVAAMAASNAVSSGGGGGGGNTKTGSIYDEISGMSDGKKNTLTFWARGTAPRRRKISSVTVPIWKPH